ncbi:MAG: hypothetical protein E7591_09415, partial [Ruminococcaceae bacterium]|nr:hypothetical protein [Oscillospiraceae bacterium]
MKKVSIRSISILLSVLMVFYAFPYGVSGSENTMTDEANEELMLDALTEMPTVEHEEAYVLHEFEGAREESMKHYKMSDGSFTAVSFPHAVHYENEENELLEIDNTLKQGDNGYSVIENPVLYSFNDDLNSDELLVCEYNDHSISLSYTNLSLEMQSVTGLNSASPENEQRSIEITNPGGQMITEDDNSASVYSLKGEEAVNEKPKIEDIINKEIKNESSIKYINISEGIDLRYDILGKNLKEYIILNNVPETNIFEFAMALENLYPVLNEDKSISLYNSKVEEIFTMPAPFMADAENNISYDCEYILEEINGIYSLKVSVSSEWLNAEERAYPVMVDPAIYVDDSMGANTITTEYDSSYSGAIQSGTRFVLMGYSSGAGVYRSYLKVNTLPDLPYGAIPVNAEILMAQYSYSGNLDELIISARTATSSNWQTSYENTALDYTKLSENTTGNFVSWNISDAAKGWYEYNIDPSSASAIVNNGIVFISENGNSDSSYARATMYGFLSNNFNINAEPKLILNYRNMIGIDNRYSAVSQNIGGAGGGAVRLYDGDLTLSRTAVVYDSVAMPFALEYIYNSKYAATQFTSAGTVLNTKNYNQMYAGKGWKLSVQQTLVRFDMNDGNGNEVPYMIYTDADGTEHYFYYNEGSGSFSDEEGLGLTAIWVDDSSWNIKTDKDEYYHFYNGYLYKIQDANGSYILIRYGNANQTSVSGDCLPSENKNRILDIKQKNAGSNEEKTVASFEYNSSGSISAISDNAGRKTTVSYNDIGQIYQFTNCDGTKMQYLYNGYIGEGNENNHKLNRAYDSELQYGIKYTYRNGSVVEFCEYSGAITSNVFGAKYWLNTTANGISYLRYSGADRTVNTADDIVTTYLFDNFARTVNSYSSNAKIGNGNFYLYGTSSAAYTPTTTTEAKKNNRVTAQASTGNLAANLVLNQGGEDGFSHWDTVGSVTVNTAAGNVRTGEKSFKIVNNGSCISQTRRINTAGTYTASVYIKVTSAGSTQGLVLSVSRGSTVYESRAIDYVNISDGWDRLSITFTANAYTDYTINLGVISGTITAYADDFQLEYGEGASRINILNNGGFEYWDYAWTPSGENEGFSNAQNSYMPGGNHSYKLTSGINKLSQMTQSVKVNAASKSETYVLGGWAKADSIPFRNEEDTTKLESKFQLFARVIYTDDSDSWYIESFNPDIRNEWQYQSV